MTDPLTLAARRAVDAGIVVVTAAGNLGRTADGQPPARRHHLAGQRAVGAHGRRDEPQTAPSPAATTRSRRSVPADRPTSIATMKPDLVAPGVGIESLADAGSTLYELHPGARLRGTVDTVAQPYLSLTGTSMAAPVVAGTIALMLEANPALTPNLVKAILHYTAERKPRLRPDGAGCRLPERTRRGAARARRWRGRRGSDGPDARGAGTSSGATQRVRGGMITADRERLASRRGLGRGDHARRGTDRLGTAAEQRYALGRRSGRRGDRRRRSRPPPSTGCAAEGCHSVRRSACGRPTSAVSAASPAARCVRTAALHRPPLAVAADGDEIASARRPAVRLRGDRRRRRAARDRAAGRAPSHRCSSRCCWCCRR